MHLRPAMHGMAKLVNLAKNHQTVGKKFKGDLELCTLCKVVKLMKMVKGKVEQFESWDWVKTALILPNTSWPGLRCSSVIVDDDQEHHMDGRGIRCGVSSCGWSIQYGHGRLCRISDIGKFLEQVSRRSLWICAAHASSEPLLSCFARRGQRLCWLCYTRKAGLELWSPRFQHLCQSFSATLWDKVIRPGCQTELTCCTCVSVILVLMWCARFVHL